MRDSTDFQPRLSNAAMQRDAVTTTSLETGATGAALSHWICVLGRLVGVDQLRLLRRGSTSPSLGQVGLFSFIPSFLRSLYFRVFSSLQSLPGSSSRGHLARDAGLGQQPAQGLLLMRSGPEDEEVEARKCHTNRHGGPSAFASFLGPCCFFHCILSNVASNNDRVHHFSGSL